MATARKRKSSPTCRIRLGAELVIGGAGELHAQLGEALIQSAPVVLDAEAVTRLDTAGLQLLQAFAQERDQRGGDWRWENVGSALREAATQLGMAQELKLPDAPAATH